MHKITVVMAYYENPVMLRRQYHQFNQYNPQVQERLEYIVVDDGSPRYPAVPPTKGKFEFQLFRMKVDVRWNQDACRNIGVKHARHEWVFLTDMDHLIPNDTLSALLFSNHLDPRIAYRFSRVNDQTFEPYKFHPNSWFLTKALYDEVGGYDERFAGYYGTDWDFRDRVMLKASAVKQLPLILIRVGREHTPDASTPKEFGRKSVEDAHAIKRIRAERSKQKGWKTVRDSFPYEKVVSWPF